MMYKLNLTTSEVLLLGECIDAMPHGKVAPLAVKIQMQITQQEIEDHKRVAPSPAPAAPVVDFSQGPSPALNIGGDSKDDLSIENKE